MGSKAQTSVWKNDNSQRLHVGIAITAAKAEQTIVARIFSSKLSHLVLAPPFSQSPAFWAAAVTDGFTAR